MTRLTRPLSKRVARIPFSATVRIADLAADLWRKGVRILDFSAGFCEPLLREQQVALVPGALFGPSGEGYVRMTRVKSWEDLREGLS